MSLITHMTHIKTDDEERKYVSDVLLYGTKNAKANLISALIYCDKAFLLEKLKEEWGEDYYHSIVELV